jgi:predicted DsbA family dithiol-disulfide isomerase
MRVDIWSDFVCPFCYIGKRRFEEALRKFEHGDEVEIVYRSFELDPQAKRDGNPGVHDMLAAKYGMSREQAIANTNQLARQAKEVGLDFHFESSISTNTFDAHRLAHYAAVEGKQNEMTERLLKAHFTDSLHLGDIEALTDLAAEIGLDRAGVLGVLKSGEYSDQVRADEAEAQRHGIRGVPFFVMNRKYGVSGAQPVELFTQTLQKAWDESHPLIQVEATDSANDAMCTDAGCAVPARSEIKLEGNRQHS